MRGNDFTEVSPEWARLAHDWIHRMENTIEASDSWYDTSCRDLLEYHLCDGNHLLNWKDKGYVTVFDLLMVSVCVCVTIIKPLATVHIYSIVYCKSHKLPSDISRIEKNRSN